MLDQIWEEASEYAKECALAEQHVPANTNIRQAQNMIDMYIRYGKEHYILSAIVDLAEAYAKIKEIADEGSD